ncbi:MAG: hypothetical protein NTV86_18610 [Planctomycetota bacterium]|nr:hypothetical protein [Planctomycetota bacterium]
MKRLSLALTVLVWMSMATTAMAAQPAAKVRPLPQAYAWMSKELPLTDEQQNGIADLNKPANMDKIAAELLKEPADKVAGRKKELALALREKNAAKIKETKAQLNAAEAELKTAKANIRLKVMDKVEADMMNLLTAEQKTKWAVHAAMPSVQTAIKPVTLTQDQTGKVRSICEAQSAGLLGAWGREKAEEWKAEIQSIVEEVKANVLSEAQLRQLPKEKSPEKKAPKDGSGK